MKLKHKHDDWKLGYAFDSTKVVKDLTELNEVQKIIREHPASPFNKKPLVTRITERGNIILTDTSFTEWIDGAVKKGKSTTPCSTNLLGRILAWKVVETPINQMFD